MYEVQIFTMIGEGHISKEMNKKAGEGWRVVSTATTDKRFIVTWQKV